MIVHDRRVWLLVLVAITACGGSEDTSGSPNGSDAGASDAADAATDALSDTGQDSTADVGGDSGFDAMPDAVEDATTDGGIDASEDGTADVESDVLTDAPPDAVEDDVNPNDAASTITLSGIVNDFFGYPVDNANVAVTESPGLSAMSGGDGRFVLQVPTETPMTLHATRAGYVDTYVQTAVPHIDTAMTLWMATPDNYDIMVGAGGGTPADAVFYITIRAGSVPCDLTGSQVTSVPPGGQVVYAEANGYPNGSYTSLPSGSSWAYIVGPTGTIEPELVSTTCTQLAYPVDVGFVTVLGPMEARPGAFHVMDMFLE